MVTLVLLSKVAVEKKKLCAKNVIDQNLILSRPTTLCHCQVIFSGAPKWPILIVLTIFTAAKEVYKERVLSSGFYLTTGRLS